MLVGRESDVLEIDVVDQEVAHEAEGGQVY